MSGVDAALRDALSDFASAPRVLIALDFDGTLAPEVDDPRAARALPEAKAAMLRLLELDGTRLALVSGRALDSLVEVSELPERALLVGSHGIEFRLDDPEHRLGLDAEELQRVARLHEVLSEAVAGVDGVWIEEKPAGFAVHTRLAAEADAHRVQLAAQRDAEAAVPGLTVRRGKNVREFSVRSATKGDAVQELRRYTGADAVFYAGDDVTDEDAFRALQDGDLGVKSGVGDTAAAFRVGGPDEVAAVLAELAAVRENALRAAR